MSKIKFTVLGCSGAYPTHDNACSGYLAETNKAKILVDCGSGIFQKLIKKVDIGFIDAVVLSHLHGDHMSDMLVLGYALQMLGLPKVKLYIPDKPEAESFILKSAKSFDVVAIREGERYQAGDITLEFAQMKHKVMTYAVKMKTSESVIVYSGDTEYTPVLGKFAKWCDLLVCDAAFNNETYQKGLPHASAKQAAEMAKEAGAAKLMLTHFLPHISTENHLVEAKSEFKYTTLAKPDLTIKI